MKKHVLLVEDDPDTRITLAYRLQYAGYQVTQAPDGEMAIALLNSDTFDVVLTDIVMGEIDGMDVLHAARQQPYLPSVIILTGHGSLETAIAAIREGAYDYLLKPCDPNDLIICIEGAVQRHTAEHHLSQATSALFQSRSRSTTTEEPKTIPKPPPYVASQPSQKPFTIGELYVGTTRQEVTLRGQTLHITPIEHAVLRCLSENPTLAMPYSDIVRHTHRLEVNDEEEALIMLKTHIRNLRKKLGSGYIITERGIGYKLIQPDDA